MADRDHPGIVAAFLSESAITFGGIPTTSIGQHQRESWSGLARLHRNRQQPRRASLGATPVIECADRMPCCSR